MFSWKYADYLVLRRGTSVPMGSSRPFYDNLLRVGCQLLALPLKVNHSLENQESLMKNVIHFSVLHPAKNRSWNRDATILKI